MNKSVLKYIFVLILIPALVIAGALVYPERSYAIVSLAVALLACVPFFISFEKTGSGTVYIRADSVF